VLARPLSFSVRGDGCSCPKFDFRHGSHLLSLEIISVDSINHHYLIDKKTID